MIELGKNCNQHLSLQNNPKFNGIVITFRGQEVS